MNLRTWVELPSSPSKTEFTEEQVVWTLNGFVDLRVIAAQLAASIMAEFWGK